jgi:hypothetical protein
MSGLSSGDIAALQNCEVSDAKLKLAVMEPGQTIRLHDLCGLELPR